MLHLISASLYPVLPSLFMLGYRRFPCCSCSNWEGYDLVPTWRLIPSKLLYTRADTLQRYHDPRFNQCYITHSQMGKHVSPRMINPTFADTSDLGNLRRKFEIMAARFRNHHLFLCGYAPRVSTLVVSSFGRSPGNSSTHVWQGLANASYTRLRVPRDCTVLACRPF